VLERAFTLCENGVIRPEDLSLSPSAETPASAAVEEAPEEAEAEESAEPQAAPTSLPEDAESLESYLEDIEKNVIVEALEATRWNKTAAAKRLGITFRALRYRLKKLGLE